MNGAWKRDIYVGTQKLRRGFTTGSAAAAAAYAAAAALVQGEAPQTVELTLPNGEIVPISIAFCERFVNGACCGVVKDGGDDVDATHGMMICCTVQETPGIDGVLIEGGDGIGRITKPGLEQPVGAAAINRVPRQMIEEAIRRAVSPQKAHHTVIVSAPQGEEIAQKTFNPQLGIVGGISILGTTGIVEPFSVDALLKTIELELSCRRADGSTRVLLTPGNYGAAFLAAQPGLSAYRPVQCSNFIGETLDLAVRMGFREILLVGHLGKLIKLAGGIMNTHSRQADCRAELMTAHAALCHAPHDILCRLMQSITTDEALAILQETTLTAPVLASLAEAAQRHLERRVGAGTAIGVCMMNQREGLLVSSARGNELWNKFSQ